MDRLRAFALLEECTGHDIWSVDHCQKRGVPNQWVEELAEAFESSFFRDSETIYLDDKTVNQYHGIHDLDLAIRLARYLGVDVDRYRSLIQDRGALVQALKEAAEDGE